MGPDSTKDGTVAYLKNYCAYIVPDEQPDEVYRRLFRHIGTRLTVSSNSTFRRNKTCAGHEISGTQTTHRR